MFEKEIEEFATKECCTTCKNTNHFCNQKCECWIFAKQGAIFGYNKCKDKLDTAIEIIEQMKDLFFDCWQGRGYEAIKFEQKVNDFLKENK